MGQDTLVGDHLVAGEKLLQLLAAGQIKIEAAAWIRMADEEKWHLYLASDIVNEFPAHAYGQVHPIVRKLSPPIWIEPLDVKLISPDKPLARAIMDMSQKMHEAWPLRYGGASLGDQSIEQAYIYPPKLASVPTQLETSSNSKTG